MSGEPDRHRRGRRTLLLRARAAAARSIEYWQHSALVRRLQAADLVNQGLLVAAVLLLCFLPFLLVLESLLGRSDASGFIGRFGLTGEAAHAVREALTAPVAPSTAIDGVSWVFFVLFGSAAAGAIQGLYERVFGVKGRGFRDAPRRLVWLAAALSLCFIGAWTQPWLDRAGGPGLVAIAALPAATAFWWFSMWLLLGGKLGWRELLPSALATGICWLGMVIVFRLTLSDSIASDYRKYGPAGVVFAIMTLLIAIGVVIVLGALLGVVWRERHRRLGALAWSGGLRLVEARVDTQDPVQCQQRERAQHRRTAGHHEAQVTAAVSGPVVRDQQHAEPRAVAEPGAGHVGDHQGRSAVDGVTELLAGAQGIGNVDLCCQRDDFWRAAFGRMGLALCREVLPCRGLAGLGLRPRH